MDLIISFFRDFLSGPLYIVIVIISVILICAGIGYFAEKSQKSKEAREKYDQDHITIDDDTDTVNNQSSIANKNVQVPINNFVNNNGNSSIPIQNNNINSSVNNNQINK